jgi:hypothetical protein
MSVSAVLYLRWPPLLKIEISSNGQNCSILSQNVPKFERPFEEISIFSNGSHLEWRAGLSDTILKGIHPGTIPARFGLIWFSGFRGEDLNVIFYQNMPNLPLDQLQPNFGGMVLGWPPFKIVSGDPNFQPRWPPS